MRSTTKLFAALFALTFGLAQAQDTVLEGFEDTGNPAVWQSFSPQPAQTRNVVGAYATLTNQTENVKEGERSLQLEWEWALPGASASGNPYYVGNTGHFWGLRINATNMGTLDAFSNTETLKADVYNPTSNEFDFALAVRGNAGSGGLDRGPLKPLNPNGWTTYEWNMETEPATGFVSGTGVLGGTTSKIDGFLFYTETAPATAAQEIFVDNIRIAGEVAEPPVPTIVLSMAQGDAPGKLVLNWQANTEPDLAGYRVYMAKNQNFGTPTGNRFTFPATPVADVPDSATGVVLEDLPTTEPLYFRVTAYDTDNYESVPHGTWGAWLRADGEAPEDVVVLDLKRWSTDSAEFVYRGYSHMTVYTAHSLQDLGRSFVTVNALAVDSGDVVLTPSEDGVVIWSAGQDGRTEEEEDTSLSLASAAALTAYVVAGGNLLISGTAIGTDFRNREIPTLDTFFGSVLRASLATSSVASNQIIPLGPFAAVGNIQTGPNIWDLAAYGHSVNEGLLAVGANTGAVYGGTPAGPGVAMTYYGNRLVYMGFSFETVRDNANANFAGARAARTALLGAVVEYLLSVAPASAQASWSLYE